MWNINRFGGVVIRPVPWNMGHGLIPFDLTKILVKMNGDEKYDNFKAFFVGVKDKKEEAVIKPTVRETTPKPPKGYAKAPKGRVLLDLEVVDDG